MSRVEFRALRDAVRRIKIADNIEQQQPMTKKWLGLGTYAEYRPLINKGLFVFHNGQKPPARCMGWLCLTSKGVKWFEENRVHVEERVNSDLKNNALAHYQLSSFN